MVMHLEAGTRDHFMAFLAREYPDLVDRYGHLYAGSTRQGPTRNGYATSSGC